MGSRGPVKGKGGRPVGGGGPKKKAAKKRAPKKKAAESAAAVGFVDGLADLTLEDLRELAGDFRPLTRADRVLLSVFWDCLGRYRKLAGMLDAETAWTFTSEKGYTAQVPEVGMLNKAVEQVLALAGRFGMSPADRARLGDLPETDDDPADPYAAHLAKIQRVSDESKTGQPVRGRKVSQRKARGKTAGRKK